MPNNFLPVSTLRFVFKIAEFTANNKYQEIRRVLSWNRCGNQLFPLILQLVDNVNLTSRKIKK